MKKNKTAWPSKYPFSTGVRKSTTILMTDLMIEYEKIKQDVFFSFVTKL